MVSVPSPIGSDCAAVLHDDSKKYYKLYGENMYVCGMALSILAQKKRKGIVYDFP